MKKIINKLFLTLLTVTIVGGVTSSIYNTVIVIHDNYLQHSYKCSEVKGFDPSKPFERVDEGKPKDFLTDAEMEELRILEDKYDWQDVVDKVFLPCNIKTGLLTYEYRWGDRDTVEFPLWTFLLKNLASWLPFLLLFGFGYWARWLIK